jgi:hypothetical protein
MAAGFIAAGLSLFGIVQSSKAGSASRAAARFTQQLTDVRNRRRVTQFLRNFRAAQAQQISQAGAREGGLDSSGFQGTLTSQQTQANTEAVSAKIQSDIQKKIIRKGAQSSELLLQANLAGTAAGFVGSQAGQDIFGK